MDIVMKTNLMKLGTGTIRVLRSWTLDHGTRGGRRSCETYSERLSIGAILLVLCDICLA